MGKASSILSIILCLSLFGCGLEATFPPGILRGNLADTTEGPRQIPSERNPDAITSTLPQAIPTPLIRESTVPTPQPVDDETPAARVTRPALEPIAFLQYSSQFGAPYDELYTIWLDTSVWQPLRVDDEGDFIAIQTRTSRSPVCVIESRFGKTKNSNNLQQKRGSYRRMGIFSNGDVVYDLFLYTSNTHALADTQHVIYILTGAGGDAPYALKPYFHAYSAYNEWESCRPLVRSTLSTLSMKRVPPAN